MNTWPGGYRHALTQGAHEAWNANHHPGTRQTCVCCDGTTDRCEEDAIYLENEQQSLGPLCLDCYLERKEE